MVRFRTKYTKPIRRLLRNVIFDLQFGGFIGGTKLTKFAHLGDLDSINTDYSALDQIFKGQILHDDVLVDVGCGKGRVLNWWLRHAPHNRVYGIERDFDLAAQVRRRLGKYPNVRIIAGDIFEHWPQEGNVFYLFNPFRRHIMQKFKDQILQNGGIASSTGKQSRIIYYFPASIDIFSACPRFSIKFLNIEPYSHQAAIITYVPE